MKQTVEQLIEELREAALGEEFFGCDGLRDDPDPLLTKAADELERLRAENEKLRALLAEAANDVADWGEYASPYFQAKYDLAGDVAKYRNAALTPHAALSGPPAMDE